LPASVVTKNLKTTKPSLRLKRKDSF
jgi:hypothetical protein